MYAIRSYYATVAVIAAEPLFFEQGLKIGALHADFFSGTRNVPVVAPESTEQKSAFDRVDGQLLEMFFAFLQLLEGSRDDCQGVGIVMGIRTQFKVSAVDGFSYNFV